MLCMHVPYLIRICLIVYVIYNRSVNGDAPASSSGSSNSVTVTSRHLIQHNSQSPPLAVYLKEIEIVEATRMSTSTFTNRHGLKHSYNRAKHCKCITFYTNSKTTIFLKSTIQRKALLLLTFTTNKSYSFQHRWKYKMLRFPTFLKSIFQIYPCYKIVPIIQVCIYKTRLTTQSRQLFGGFSHCCCTNPSQFINESSIGHFVIPVRAYKTTHSSSFPVWVCLRFGGTSP